MTKGKMYLSELCSKNEEARMIEEDELLGVDADSFTIDEGFHLEIYCNYEGKYEEDSKEGASWFIYIDTEITLINLLDMFKHDGNILEDTLTISVIPNEDPRYADERNRSVAISLKLKEYKDVNSSPEYKEYIFQNKEENSQVKNHPSSRYAEKYIIKMFEEKYKNKGYQLIKNK